MDAPDPCLFLLTPAAQGGRNQPAAGDETPPRPRATRRFAALPEVGRKEWKNWTAYHRRSLSEIDMFRCQAIIGPTLRSRTLPNQKTEAAVGARCLNQFTGLGMPISIKTA